MSSEDRILTWMLMLLLLPGVPCRDWRVEYQQQHICAVKGSSVVIPCSFHYPETYKVQSVKWGHERCDIYKGPFIFDSESNDASSRFQYIGDKHHNCSFKIQQVEHNDTGKHAFRFVANSRNDQVKPWTGSVGSVLTVVNLEVVMTKPNGNRITMEGDSVNLTCINSCDSENDVSAFIWFKNRELIHEGPAFYLSSISPANSGNYTCSLKSHKGTTSEVISIDVEYGPKNTSVSVRPSADAVAGSNITLTCSSHANPAVENYTWFKTNEQITVEAGKEPELYFREIFPHDGGQYFCSATNKYGSQNSSTVTLKVKAYLPTFTRYALITAAVAMLMIVTIVIAIRRLNKKGARAPEATSETGCAEDLQNTVYVNLPMLKNSQSKEENQCEGATAELIYATVDFSTNRNSNTQQQVDSHDDDTGVIYSTVCRDQILNRSYIKPNQQQHSVLQ